MEKRETGNGERGTGEVINNPASRTCARVDCLPYSSQSGFINKPISCQTTGARVRAREAHPAIRNPEAYFKAWRKAKFGGDIDPVRVAVEEAVAAFSSGKDAQGQSDDLNLWLKIANRVGESRFLDAFFEKVSELRDMAQKGKHLWNPAASFQKLLNKRFPKKGGV